MFAMIYAPHVCLGQVCARAGVCVCMLQCVSVSCTCVFVCVSEMPGKGACAVFMLTSVLGVTLVCACGV